MPSPECKVYFDGSHYIAIPHTTRRYKPRRKPKEELITIGESPPNEEGTKEEVKPDEQDDLTPIERIAREGTSSIEDAPSPPAVKEKTSSEVLNENGEPKVMTRRELFNETYAACIYMKYRERKAMLLEKMRPYFKSDEATKNYVENNLARKKRNLIARRIRLTRKANLQDFNYFVTVTYFYGH